MEPPRINPVGVVEYPSSYRPGPSRRPRSQRWVALAMLVVFATVVLSTTVVSIGQYCLTSDGGNTSDLPSR